MGALNEKLTAMREAGDAKRDPAATAVMHQATRDLAASGIVEGVVKLGQAAPRFIRPTLAGETLRLTTLLGRGPVILSFFRGRW